MRRRAQRALVGIDPAAGFNNQARDDARRRLCNPFRRARLRHCLELACDGTTGQKLQDNNKRIDRNAALSKQAYATARRFFHSEAMGEALRSAGAHLIDRMRGASNLISLKPKRGG